MTAEIAILNKTAVALASDSAVTISSGNQTLKIFESADKLFELSNKQPLGVMVYNGMQFMGVPVEAVVKSFRAKCQEFQTVRAAANAFLKYLYHYVDGAPPDEIKGSISGVVVPIAHEINDAMEKALLDLIRTDGVPGSADDFQEAQRKKFNEVLSSYRSRVADLGPASFLQRDDRKQQKRTYEQLIDEIVRESVGPIAHAYAGEIAEICKNVLNSSYISSSKTGIVFAGFGEDEIFPTLISYEVDSVFEAKIRAFQTDECDIDRNGKKAFVRPFAQKEMVDRFLHGLDERLQQDITRFSREAVQKISDGIIDALDLKDDDRGGLNDLARRAEKKFIQQLQKDAFTSFQERSRREIESMIEFMPKPELAKMAEALIDLTSIKRKVTQGMETVGGPVDVAVISKHDGFVWVKRKHYFPKDLNSRYFERNNLPNEPHETQEED
ncbi:hypothetical protein [Maritimibacter sp. HL-12]|uniref:hypothetical protein n=1 Tax=Maritimibacter sp. HL-12 TaxID=1162418 RepID=UPI000A0F3454|nr:hypothetical protein [Maritimibacter sp. HL-12]SMH41693.1 hypothetical protein SAMN05661107_1277 [Maritimibacter sp. HL-12]